MIFLKKKINEKVYIKIKKVMKRNRNFKTSMLLLLRKLGMLCKKTQPNKRLRISHTIWPDRINAIDSERHVWVETKKTTRPMCAFNLSTESCVCGVSSIEQFNNSCKK
jgi:hypothetical protein